MQAAFATRGVAVHHNRPATITEGGRVTTYGYDKAGRAVLMTAGNGQTTNNTYKIVARRFVSMIFTVHCESIETVN